MGATNFDALIVGGIPLVPGFARGSFREPIPGSRVICVGSGATQIPGIGLATATLFGSTGALALLENRQNKGDIIYVLPGHVESVSAADMGSHTGTASGFSIIGLGIGTQRPAFNWTAAASTWLLDTSGVEIVNCILDFAVTAATVVVTPITVSAPNCRFVGNYIHWGLSTTVGCGSTLGAIAFTTAADYCEFINNTCVNEDVAGTTGNAITLLSINGADYINIVGNKITGATTATTVGPIHFLTTLSKNVTIAWNEIENLIASSTICISSAIAGVTGKIMRNSMRVNSGIVAITASSNISCTGFQNFTADTVNQNGALDVLGGTSS